MCLTCNRGWTVLHVLWSIVYVCCGAAQLVSGIFFFISIPSLHLSSNLWVGTWNIFVGIGSGMVACFGRLSTRRQEILLYMAASILVVNAVNAVMTEWAFYVTDMKQVVGAHRYAILIEYASWATRVAAAALITVSFLDTQLAFCSMQTVPKPGKMKKPRGSHEQVSDIEYIIPRRKSSKPHTVCNAYSQSWVYDSDTANTSNDQQNGNGTLYLTLPQEATPKPRRKSATENGIVSDTAHLIDNPVVHIEEASDDSNSNSDRKLCYMKSFSRSASPVVLSASSSQVSLNNPPIYECLQKLTEPEIYRTRLTSALSNKSDEYQAPQPAMVRTTSPQVEKVQYASLMKELQKAIVSKKEPSKSPPSNSDSATTSEKTSSSKTSKNSDAEFSKELEAALQLIQDLESPNTIETPSEPKIFGPAWRNSDASEDEKTLSAVGSLADIATPTDYQPELTTFKPGANGKGACIIIQNSESQSTSGYSSPTHKTPNWSTTSSVNSSNHDLGKSPVSYTIHNTKSTAVISIYTDGTPKTKNITLVKITGDTEKRTLERTSMSNEDNNANNEDNRNDTNKKEAAIMIMRRPSAATSNLWNVKSLLRKKKNVPKMCPELEGAIIKSESLAYLTERELLARHQRNKDIHRQIEQRVLQQLGTPRTESQC